MTPVDEFLGSVREVFAENRAGDWTRAGLVLATAVALSINVGWWFGRRKRRLAAARRVEALAAAAGLSGTDRAFLARIARDAGQPLPEVMSTLVVFELATARALAGAPPTVRPAAGSVFEQIHRLRKALGFSPLPAHRWLLTTRELSSGEPVSLGGLTGQIAEVNEATFAVDFPGHAPLSVGGGAALGIVRIDDSRYLSRVRVLAIETASSGTGACRAFFSHDEHPERHQSREHVRVRVAGPVTVQVAEPAKIAAEAPPTVRATGAHQSNPQVTIEPGSAAAAGGLTGTLVDVSAGGLAVDLPAETLPLPAVGSHVRCSFAVGDGPRFESLAALVLGVGTVPATGVRHLRASFVALPDAERDRLAAAVAQHLRSPPLG
jgi:PilZ domain-containing protein